MYRYIFIESKSENIDSWSFMIDLFSEFIQIESYEYDTKYLHIFYSHPIEVSLKDISINMVSDTLMDLRIYESYSYEKQSKRKENHDYVLRLLKEVPFHLFSYLDSKTLLSYLIKKGYHIDHTSFFQKYAQDQMMLETVKTYLDANQNSTLAAKKLYIHRNTLIQRLDKFIQITGFDPKRFKDAFIIYYLIN